MKTLTSLLKTCQMSYVILTYKTIKLKTLTCLSKTLIFIQFKNTVTGFLLFKNNAIGYRVIGSHSSQKFSLLNIVKYACSWSGEICQRSLGKKENTLSMPESSRYPPTGQSSLNISQLFQLALPLKTPFLAHTMKQEE